MASILYDYTKSLRGLEYKSEEYGEKRAEVHKRSASKLLWLSRFNGGMYYKFGQYLSSMDGVLPQEYT